MTDAFRTPDERFEGLPDFPWEPSYREVDGLRLAHIDTGEGQPVMLFHGEPTWSFLWRKVMPPLLDAGFRCIAPDYAGFGRSDKPTDIGWYSYDRHSEQISGLVEELDLRDAVAVVHDWGGPIGLRAAVEHADRFSADRDHGHRAVHGRQKMSRHIAQVPRLRRATEDLPVVDAGSPAQGARDPGAM